MLQKFLTTCVLSISLANCLLIFFFITRPPDQHIIPQLEFNQKGVSPSEISVNGSAYSVISRINAKNSEIKTFSSDSITVKTWDRGLRYKLTAYLRYEKDLRFRLVLSLFGKELDIGSNDTIFWYWSRRDPEPGVHWAKNEDLPFTRLKSPFNPFFFRDSLGLGQIDIKRAKKITTKNNFLVVTYQTLSGTGDDVLCSYLINMDTERIEGLVIYDLLGNQLASCEIKKFSSNGLPMEILYIWHEEKKIVLFTFGDPTINSPIDKRNWELPEHEPKIEMSIFYFNPQPTFCRLNGRD